MGMLTLYPPIRDPRQKLRRRPSSSALPSRWYSSPFRDISYVRMLTVDLGFSRQSRANDTLNEHLVQLRSFNSAPSIGSGRQNDEPRISLYPLCEPRLICFRKKVDGSIRRCCGDVLDPSCDGCFEARLGLVEIVSFFRRNRRKEPFKSRIFD